MAPMNARDCSNTMDTEEEAHRSQGPPSVSLPAAAAAVVVKAEIKHTDREEAPEETEEV